MKYPRHAWHCAGISALWHMLVHVLVLAGMTGFVQAQVSSISPGHGEGSIPDLATDRPDQTESAVTVPRGWLQVEAGVVFEQAGDDGSGLAAPRQWTLPGVLLRLGVTEVLELRFATDVVTLEREERRESEEYLDGSITERGTEPLSLGLKYQFTGGTLPSIALIGMFSLPSTSSGFLVGNPATAEFRLAVAQDLGEMISAGCNLAFEQDFDHGESGLHYTAVLGLDATEAIGLFAEVYGSRDPGANHFLHRVDGGATWLLTPDLQLDAAVGVDLNSHDASGRPADAGFFLGAGISWRFPLLP